MKPEIVKIVETGQYRAEVWHYPDDDTTIVEVHFIPMDVLLDDQEIGHAESIDHAWLDRWIETQSRSCIRWAIQRIPRQFLIVKE